MVNHLISVIVPIYGVEKYLNRCVTSIVNQTYKNLEIILVDDGSQDNCPKMCDEWAKRDDRIKVIHKENGGQSTARNAGLDVCTGEYIAFVDSDDAVCENMYEVMLKAILETKADIAVCGNLVHSGMRVVDTQVAKELVELDAEGTIRAYFLESKISTTVMNKLYAATIFKNIRFPEIRAKEDVMVLHELLHLSKKTILLPESLYKYFVRNDSTEGSWFSEKQLLSIEAAKKRQIFIKENYPHLSSAPKIRFNYISALKINCNQINQSFAFKKFKSVYEELINDMRKEYERLCNENIEGTVEMLAEYKSVLTHPFLFRLSGIRVGCMRRAKRTLRTILNKFINKQD